MVRRNYGMREVHKRAYEEEFRQADMRHIREAAQKQNTKGFLSMAEQTNRKYQVREKTFHHFNVFFDSFEEYEEYRTKNPRHWLHYCSPATNRPFSASFNEMKDYIVVPDGIDSIYKKGEVIMVNDINYTMVDRSSDGTYYNRPIIFLDKYED